MVSKKEELLLRNKSAFKQLVNNWCRNLAQEVLAQLWILVESFDHLLFHRFFLGGGRLLLLRLQPLAARGLIFKTDIKRQAIEQKIETNASLFILVLLSIFLDFPGHPFFVLVVDFGQSSHSRSRHAPIVTERFMRGSLRHPEFSLRENQTTLRSAKGSDWFRQIMESEFT